MVIFHMEPIMIPHSLQLVCNPLRQSALMQKKVEGQGQGFLLCMHNVMETKNMVKAEMCEEFEFYFR